MLRQAQHDTQGKYNVISSNEMKSRNLWLLAGDNISKGCELCGIALLLMGFADMLSSGLNLEIVLAISRHHVGTGSFLRYFLCALLFIVFIGAYECSRIWTSKK